jgi:hypothetical protein
MISMDPGTWIAALFTIGVISFLVRDNPLTKIAEYTAVGAAIGHVAVQNGLRLWGFVDKTFYGGAIENLIPLALIFTMMSRWYLPRKYRWITRYSVATIYGINIGTNTAQACQTLLIGQLKSTLVSVTTPDMLLNVSRLLIAVVLITSMAYFTFSYGLGGNLGKTLGTTFYNIGKFGRFFLMVGFGGAFMALYMGRSGLMMGRLYFLINDWLQIAG